MMPAEYSMESLHDANWCCGRFFFVFLIYLESFYPSLKDFKEKVYAISEQGDFFIFRNVIQHCYICRPSDSAVSEDAGIELRTVATPSHQSYLVGTETANELTPYIFLTQDWSGALAAKLPGRCRNCQ